MVNSFIPERHRQAAWNENQPWLRVQVAAKAQALYKLHYSAHSRLLTAF